MFQNFQQYGAVACQIHARGGTESAHGCGRIGRWTVDALRVSCEEYGTGGGSFGTFERRFLAASITPVRMQQTTQDSDSCATGGNITALSSRTNLLDPRDCLSSLGRQIARFACTFLLKTQQETPPTPSPNIPLYRQGH
jgi:hypothetical protein